MEPTRTLTIKIAGAHEVSAPPTWGQRAIWDWHGFVERPDGTFTNGKLFDMPPELDADCVAEALATVLRRQDALRTVFELDAGRLVRQDVEPGGELTLDVYETVPERAREVGETVAAALSEVPWTCREWPVRVALVTAGTQETFLVMSHNRLLIDVQSMDFIAQEVSAVARGEEWADPRWQPVAEAVFQNGPDGQALSATALEHWRRVLDSAPATVFDFPVREPDEERFVMAQIESRALELAVHTLRRRWRVTGGPLVLAAMSVALGRFTGHDTVVLQMFAGNRTHPDRRRMLGTLISGGLLDVSLTAPTFDDVARRASRAVSAAHQSGYCDPQAVAELRADLERRRGAAMDLSLFFNDMQTGQDPPDADPERTRRELAALADGGLEPTPITWAGWDATWQARVTRQDIRFMLTTQHSWKMPLMLFCDTRYFSRETMAELVSGTERLLVAAAVSDVTQVEELARISGVEPVTRGAGWAAVGGGWVDLPAAQALLRTVAGTDGAALRVEDGVLVGYVPAGAPPLTDLHRALVAAVGRRCDVRAPDRYRRVTGDDLPTVLEDGDGRP